MREIIKDLDLAIKEVLEKHMLGHSILGRMDLARKHGSPFDYEFTIKGVVYPRKMFDLNDRLNTDLLPKTLLTPVTSHDDHEIVENIAGGKSFRYCRNCKEEVT